MLQDRYGNPLTTSSATARDAYVRGVDLFLGAEAGAEAAFETAVAEDPNFAAAHIGLARSQQSLSRLPDAKAALVRARACSSGVTTAELGQIETLGALIEGRGADAYAKARAQMLDHPRDAMTAQTCSGVFGLIGFSGRRGREAECLAFFDALAPHYGDDWWFLGTLSFAQTEAGLTAAAADTIERSLAGNPRNANAAHYRAHLYYENGEADAGLAYLRDWFPDYDRGGLLYCHLSWHIALWTMAAGDLDDMWRMVDQDMAPGVSVSPAINILTDLAALYYRMELKGYEVPAERWRTLSDFALKTFPNPGLAFVDVHAALAHAMAGNGEALAQIIRDAKGPAADIVSRLAEAFQALSRQDWSSAVGHLSLAMADHERIGGSRAQRDLIEYALVGALLRLGQRDEARRLLIMRRPRTATTGVVAGL